MFAVFWSACVPATTAVFVIFPTTVGLTTIVMLIASPFAIVPSWQVIAFVPVHVPFVVATETNATSEGSESVTTTSVAVSGPLLVTTSV